MSWHAAVASGRICRINRIALAEAAATKSGATDACSATRLSINEKLAYGLGDAAANFVFQTQITFLMFFYTDVFGIAAGTAGTILLVSRVVDAFNDPIVGALADRTNTRWGRYRPWVLWTAVPLAVALVLCYTTPPLDPTGKIIWAIATYNVLMIIYAANNIPYCALSGVMTGDSQERTSLASWRFVCAMAAALVVNVFTLDLVKFFGRGDAALGYQLTMAPVGRVGRGLLRDHVCVHQGADRARVHEQRSSLRQDLSDLFRNGPWIALFVLAVLDLHPACAAQRHDVVLLQSLLADAKTFLTGSDNFGVFNGVGLAFTMLGVMLSKPLAARFGKRAHVSSLLAAVFRIDGSVRAVAAATRSPCY